MRFFLFYNFTFLLFGSLSGQEINVNLNPFDNLYFIENKGQWDKQKNYSNFVLWTGVDNVFLNNNGSGFKWEVNYLETNVPFDSKTEEKKKKSRKIHTDSIEFKLLGTNPNAKVQLENKSNHYWTYGPKELNSFGYKTVKFLNIYPNIDVVYEIGNSELGLIKYSFILHPGANPEQIRINYEGEVLPNIRIEPKEILINKSVFELKESGLKTTTQNNKEIPCTYKLTQNGFGFNLDLHSLEETYIIDPYIKRVDKLKIAQTKYKQWKDFSNMVIMSDYDKNDNVYLMSACLLYPQIAKFDKQGNLLWIFSGQIPSIDWYSSQKTSPIPGAFCIDKLLDKIYMGEGWESTKGPSVIRLNLVGNFDSFILKSKEPNLELWDLNFGCNSIIISGGGNIYKKRNIWTVPKNNDTTPIIYYSNTNDSINYGQDIVRSIVDADGYLFSIINYIERYYKFDTSRGLWVTDYIITKIRLIKSEPKLIGNVFDSDLLPFITFQEVENYPNLSQSEWLTNHNNCLALNSQYAFIYDGKVILAIDKIDGKIICADSIPYHNGLRGHLGQSGISVDECNHIFLGGDSTKLLIFGFDGKKFHFDTSIQMLQNSSRSTIDVRLNPNTGRLFVSGDSFVGSVMNPFTCIKNSFVLDTSTYPKCEGDYIGMVKEGDTSENYTFKWSLKKGNTDSVLRVINRKIGQKDTFKIRNLIDSIELMVTQNYECNGPYQKVVFIAKRKDTTLTEETLCANEVFTIRNKSFTKDTAFSDILQNVNGCDSIVHYKLVFNKILLDSQNYQVCTGDTLRFPKRRIYETGLYIDTFSQINGCDSIVFRNAVFKGSKRIQTVDICSGDSLVIGSNIYFKSGNYSDTLKDFSNCDSIINTTLRIHKDTQYTVKYSACSGDTLIFSGQYYTTDTQHFDRYVSMWGCDSVVVRNIVFLPLKSNFKQFTLCKNQSYSYNGSNFRAPYKITDTLMAQNGCDSIIEIELKNTALEALFDLDTTDLPTIQYFQNSKNAIKFIWHFGDGNKDSTSINPKYNYTINQDQKIEICLTVKDSMGCSDTLCRDVNLYKIGYWLYNVFSPNGDNFNEIHRIGFKGKPILYDIYIYSRWGTLVYETTQSKIDDASKYWNGQVMNTGPECPSGTYFVIYKFYNNGTSAPPHTMEAALELIR